MYLLYYVHSNKQASKLLYFVAILLRCSSVCAIMLTFNAAITSINNNNAQQQQEFACATLAQALSYVASTTCVVAHKQHAATAQQQYNSIVANNASAKKQHFTVVLFTYNTKLKAFKTRVSNSYKQRVNKLVATKQHVYINAIQLNACLTKAQCNTIALMLLKNNMFTTIAQQHYSIVYNNTVATAQQATKTANFVATAQQANSNVLLANNSVISLA